MLCKFLCNNLRWNNKEDNESNFIQKHVLGDCVPNLKFPSEWANLVKSLQKSV